jgi:ABC-type ATPase involved in cell division
MISLVDVRLDHPRGGAPLVSEGNLKVSRGEVAIVVGAAGVGTSRLVAAALGEVIASAGRIEVLGHDVAKLRRSSLRLLRRKVGIVPQDLCLLADRSAQVNVALPLEIDGIPRSISISRAADVMLKLGLEEIADVPVCELPPSIKQKVAVARALVRDPELVIADHPTSMQDATGTELICDALAAATSTAAVLIFGREPGLLSFAEQQRWRTLGLVDGQLLAPELDVPESIPNIVPFPISARTAGVA